MQTVYRKKQNASLTVFFALTTLMIISLILSLIEVLHYNCVKTEVTNVSKIGIESAFADYNRLIYEDYGILAIDGGYCNNSMNIDKVKSRIDNYLADNLSGGVNFLSAFANEIEIDEYGVLTDGRGAPFIKEAARVAAYSIPGDLIDGIGGTIESIDVNSLDNSQTERMLTDSVLQMQEASEDKSIERENIENPLSGQDQALLESNGNPIDSAMEWKAKGVLSQVIQDVSAISDKAYVSNDRPSSRIRVSDTGSAAGASAMDKVMCTQYFSTKFSNYVRGLDHKGLQYEWEYVLNGKDSDLKNLEATIEKLVLLREGQNLIALAGDSMRQNEALSIATAICSALALPELIAVVQAGIIAAWAYLESILDVRLLLAGGKVPMVKTPEQWTSNILLFPNYVNPAVKANPVASGLSYIDYLKTFTVILPEGTIGMRALDVLEDAARSHADYVNIRIENFIYKMELSFEYSANPIFATLTPMLSGRLSEYTFKRKEKMSFI